MRMISQWVRILLLGCAVLFIAACSTKVERIGTGDAQDLSGRWNDTDSRLVSEEMIADVLGRPWLGDYRQHTGKRPVVIVGEVSNLSHEHINVKTFVSDMERALINSGSVDIVASSQERGEIRDERKDQAINARASTQKLSGEELGADFMLKGTVNSIIDTEDKQSVRYYQVDLNLIDLADNRKVWAGQKKLRKLVDKRFLRF